MSKKPVSASGVINMKGTASIEASVLFRGIMDYYTGLSGLEINANQITKRDHFISDGVLICDDSLDEQIMALQERYILADGNASVQKEIIEEVLEIL